MVNSFLMKKLNLSGKKFGRLTVVKESQSKKNRESTWDCLCDCGKEKTATRNKLMSGKVKSCGCFGKESRASRTSKMTEKRRKYSPMEASAKRVWGGRYSDGDISFQMFLELAAKNCHYCDAPPSGKFSEAKWDKRRSEDARTKGEFVYNGLDRLNSSLGHNLDNVVTCCKRCNMAKGAMPYQEFLEMVRKIYERLVGPKKN